MTKGSRRVSLHSMHVQAKAPWLLIAVVCVVSYAIVTVAQWVYPVKASPTPELNDRWRRWANEIRQHEKDSPTTAPPTPGSGVPALPSRTNP